MNPETTQDNQPVGHGKRKKILLLILIALVLGGSMAGFTYWKILQSRISVENAEISAPKIDLAPQGTGVLEEVYVHEGDFVLANSAVARVGDELIKTKVSGIIISTQNDIGKTFNRGEATVSMIDPTELRVIGRIEEDKGLKDIKVGQRATFTVDAFGSKEYVGTVDEVSPASRDSDVVFSISNTRPVKEFNIKIRFNVDQYSEFKSGMSAKVLIYR